jgi:hypothetical protein
VRADKLDGGKAMMIQAFRPEANGQPTEPTEPKTRKGKK